MSRDGAGAEKGKSRREVSRNVEDEAPNVNVTPISQKTNPKYWTSPSHLALIVDWPTAIETTLKSILNILGDLTKIDVGQSPLLLSRSSRRSHSNGLSSPPSSTNKDPRGTQASSSSVIK
jgi:hypothetical protein